MDKNSIEQVEQIINRFIETYETEYGQSLDVKVERSNRSLEIIPTDKHDSISSTMLHIITGVEKVFSGFVWYVTTNENNKPIIRVI